MPRNVFTSREQAKEYIKKLSHPHEIVVWKDQKEGILKYTVLPKRRSVRALLDRKKK